MNEKDNQVNQEVRKIFQNNFARRKLMYGEWTAESETERELRVLAEQYHDQCDAYDRRVCSGISPRTGEPMPVTPQESGLINRNAREVRAYIMREATGKGFTEVQVSDAIRKYSR